MTNEQIDQRRSELRKRAIELEEELAHHRNTQDEIFRKLAENNAIVEEKKSQIKEINEKLKEY